MPFKQVVNGAIQRGLPGTSQSAERRPFVLQTYPMGLRVTDPGELRRIDEDFELKRFREWRVTASKRPHGRSSAVAWVRRVLGAGDAAAMPDSDRARTLHG